MVGLATERLTGNKDENEPRSGKLISFCQRILVIFYAVSGQYQAFVSLITGKSILHFSSKDEVIQSISMGN